MFVELVQVNQSVLLSDTSTSFSVVFRLPDGQLVQAELNNEATQAILECQVKNLPQPQAAPPPQPTPAPREPVGWVPPAPSPQPEPPPPPAPAPVAAQPPPEAQVFSQVDEDEDERVQWRLLSDEVLTPKMKNILNAVGLPDEVSVSELKRTVEKIVSKLPRPDVTPPERAPRQAKTVIPGVGQVAWHNGPVVVNRPPIKTVPKDSMGYPVVQGRGHDPGEHVGRGDTDEDGVAQL